MKNFIADTIFVRLFLVLLVILNLSHFLGLAIYQKYDELTELQEYVLNPQRPSIYFWLNMRLLVAAIAAYIAARWLSRPIKKMADAAQELGENLNRPPLEENKGPQEVRQAAIVFNQMHARIHQQLAEKNRFLAAVSHDLRTPLTRIRLRAEKIPDSDVRQDIRKDIDEMAQMLDETLDYLRGSETSEHFQLLDITSLVHSMTEDFVELGFDVTMEGSAKPFNALPIALKRCLNNLIENALHYGNSAFIKLTDQPENLIIEIRDNGMGIPAHELEAVFSPFYRLEDSRSRHTGGTGLGLAIAKDIALKHGGSISLHNHPDGGLLARLELPRHG